MMDILGKLIPNTGDEISAEQRTFLLLQNAAAALSDEAAAPSAEHDWWHFIAAGIAQRGMETLEWLPNFEAWAAEGNPMAIALINKMTELRLKQ